MNPNNFIHLCSEIFCPMQMNIRMVTLGSMLVRLGKLSIRSTEILSNKIPLNLMSMSQL